jgi:hypothetical protein
MRPLDEATEALRIPFGVSTRTVGGVGAKRSAWASWGLRGADGCSRSRARRARPHSATIEHRPIKSRSTAGGLSPLTSAATSRSRQPSVGEGG